MKICFVTISGSPEYLGGYALYHKNLIKYIQKCKKDIKISWVYLGNKNRKYFREGVEYFEIKTNKLKSFTLIENFYLCKFFKKNYFDIINTTGGLGIFSYKKKKGQKIIQTFHGTAYYFNKNHFKRFNFFEKILFSPLLLLSWLQERPHKKTDKFICVSEKVKRQVEKLYGKKENTVVIRTGVDLKDFKVKDKNKIKERLGLDKRKNYGLYVGRGGYWTKGLDRVTKLSEEMYNLDKNYRLIVVGADFKKVRHLLEKEFIIYMEKVEREKIPDYYSVADIFFCMSRYEGGAPTLVVSEAMASGCLVVCSKDSEQEIIKDSENGLVVEDFDKKDAKKIFGIKGKKKITENSIRTIKEISFEKWGKRYLEVLLK